MKQRPDLLHGEDMPREPLQKRSQAKRSRLKEAALSVFEEKGYEGASVDEISQRAALAVGSFYQHFRSKRQLLLVLMDELLDVLSRLNLQPKEGASVRAGLRGLLAVAFAQDLRYLGAYRAWQEAVHTDAELARMQKKIDAWTTARVNGVFQLLQKTPGARAGVDVSGLARVMDGFFWSLLSQAARMPKRELDQWIDAATHLIYHALFVDSPKKSRTK